MTAKELFDASQLSAAITQLTQDVKAHPTDTQARTFLFGLLCFAGDYQRAERQLDVIAQQDVNTRLGAQIYRNMIAAEQARRRLFSGGVHPHFLLEPPNYVHLHLEALTRLCEGRLGEAGAALQEAKEHYPVLIGSFDGTSFEDWSDGDELIGPILEIFAYDQYVWLPFEQIRAVHIAPPQQLLDLLWLPATLEGWQGPIGEVYLPVLYIASSDHPNDEIKLGRRTDWQASGDGPVRGVGQRMFIFDKRDRAILDIRELEFTSSSANR